jgi:hypothetical protein
MSNHLHPYVEAPAYPSTLWIKSELRGDIGLQAAQSGELVVFLNLKRCLTMLSTGIIKKGLRLAGLGVLVSNSYKDKVTQEEKKFYLLRITKLLSEAAIKTLSESTNSLK